MTTSSKATQLAEEFYQTGKYRSYKDAFIDGFISGAQHQQQWIDVLKDANDILRSCYAVIQREGKDTRWHELKARVEEELNKQRLLLFPKYPPSDERP